MCLALRNRFPLDEAFNFNVLDTNRRYPAEVLKKKYLSICTTFGLCYSQDGAQRFVTDHSKIISEAKERKEEGMLNVATDACALSRSVCMETWEAYKVCRSIPATSASAERPFSLLTRLLGKFRQRLCRMLPALMQLRLSFPDNYLEGHFGKSVLQEWSTKQRREKNEGLTLGVKKKKGSTDIKDEEKVKAQ